MISEEARAIAASPFLELDLGVLFRRFDLDEVAVCSSCWPTAAVVVPLGDTVEDLPAAVEATRAAVREVGDSVIAWWVAPRHDQLVPALEELGLRHGDAPGFESVETAMALDAEPAGGRAEGVEVRVVETFDDLVAGGVVLEHAFGLPAVSEQENRRLFDDYLGPDNSARQYLALVDGRPVGVAFSVAGKGALNLFGGGVLPDARGRGIYRALTWARWDDAVELGTPVLTVQAGRQSGPILERLGFQPLTQVRMYVETLSPPNIDG